MSNYLCRTCLTTNGKTNEMQLLNEDFLQQIEALSGIEITLHEKFPSRICTDCVNSLKISTRFRDLCRSSENTLLTLMIQSDVKAELLDVVDEFDTVSTESNQGNEDFFQELIVSNDPHEISEIDDFPLKEEISAQVFIKDDEQSSYEHIASDSESILSLINEKKPKLTRTSALAKMTKHRKFERDSEHIMCEICGNTYKQRSLLNTHMRRHLEDKPFECEICTKAFTCASELRRHMRTHTGEKPYVCRFCGRTFTDRSTNIRHERIHTNTRPYTCQTCGKSFTYSTVLKNHMLIHTGEKRFACQPCNKTFSRKHQLDQHCATITHQQTVRSICTLSNEINTSIEVE